MHAENKIREALEGLRAADDTYERVMERAAAGGRRRRGGPLHVATVAGLAVAGALATGGVAYAVAGGDVFGAWGDHGMGERVAWSHDGYTFSREYGTVDPGQVSEDLAGSVEAVGLSVEGSGYTLTIGSMIVDENGCGVASFTLENPDGVRDDPSYGVPGELVLADDASLDAFAMDASGEGTSALLDNRWICDQGRSTDTVAQGTLYFASSGRLENVLEGVSWHLSWDTGTWLEDEGRWSDDHEQFEESTETFRPTKVVEARTYASDDGSTVRVSPFSISVEASWSGPSDAGLDAVALRLADGSEYVILGEDGTMNYYTASKSGAEVKYTFTRLVDVSEVVAVELSGRTGTELEGDLQDHAVELVPAD